MKIIFWLIFASSLIYASFFTEKDRLDREVKRLCAIDGGIKVYETVKLPAEQFTQFGSINIPYKEIAKPEDEYYYESYTTHLAKGNPELLRLHTQFYRKSGNKLLGESVVYMRRGGGMPGPWHVHAFSCPEKEDDGYLKKQIFKGMKEKL